MFRVYAWKNGEPKNASGRQELFEPFINQVL